MAALEPARLTRASRLRGVYVIINEGGPDPLLLARAALEAGVRVVQYRAKNGIVARTLRGLRDAARTRGALLIVNDDVEAAAIFDCDGVHLGPDDAGFGAVADVRRAIGDRLIGLSCGTVEEATAANVVDADYVGVGAVFTTTSKPDAGTPIGLDGLRRVAAASRFPVAAIGGIDSGNLVGVARSGVAMAAVIAAVAAAPDPLAAARELVDGWRAAE